MPRLNPFLFTEPYKLEKRVIEQDRIQKFASDYCNSIKKGLPNFVNFITGEAGIGKTNTLLHIYEKKLEKNNIKTLYIDCPIGFDLVNNIHNEMLLDENYPEEMKSLIRTYRKQKPSTPRELLEIIEEIASIFFKLGYDGFVIIIDELENSVPYIEKVKDKERPILQPLALRQLSELLLFKHLKNLITIG